MSIAGVNLKHIVAEHFAERANPYSYGEKKPSRLLEILMSGKVISCVTCGAFTQTTKKKKDKCHKCGGALINLAEFTPYFTVESKWLYCTYTPHVTDQTFGCYRQTPLSCFLQWDVNAPLNATSEIKKVYSAMKKNLHFDEVFADGKYCTACGSSVLSYTVKTTGSLSDVLQRQDLRLEWLTGEKYHIFTFDQRAKNEEVQVETLMSAPKKRKRAQPVPLLQQAGRVRFAPPLRQLRVEPDGRFRFVIDNEVAVDDSE